MIGAMMALIVLYQHLFFIVGEFIPSAWRYKLIYWRVRPLLPFTFSLCLILAPLSEIFKITSEKVNAGYAIHHDPVLWVLDSGVMARLYRNIGGLYSTGPFFVSPMELQIDTPIFRGPVDAMWNSPCLLFLRLC